MKKIVLLIIIVIATTTQGVWGQLYNYGTGSVAANPSPFTATGTGYTITGNDFNSTGNVTWAMPANAGPGPLILNFANFTLNAGHIFTVTGINSGPVIIRCTGTMTINGTFSCAGGTGQAGASSVGGLGGSGGGGGGRSGGLGGSPPSPGTGSVGNNFGSSSGRGGGGTGVSGVSFNFAAGGGGGSYGTTGATGGNGNGTGGAPGAVYGAAGLTVSMTQASVTSTILGGSSGGGGGARHTFGARAGGGGGGGGGAIQITANTIVFGASGLINANGGNGGNSQASGGAGGGGGGGGSGGTINLQYFTLTGYLAAKTTVAGGSGGTSSVSATSTGGVGGLGRILTQQDVFLCTQPTTGVTSLTSTVVSGTQVDVSFTRGNGDGGVLLVARTTATTRVSPTSGSAYTTTTFGSGSGSQLTGTNNFVIYNSNTAGNITVPVTGLTANTPYSFDCYEYNSSGTCYLAWTSTQTTANTPTSCTPPTTQASGISVANVTNTSMDVNWSGNGNGDRVIVIGNATGAVSVTALQIQGNSYTASANPNTNFTGGTQIGTGNYVLYVGTGNSITLQNLTAGTSYNYAVFTFDNATSCYNISAGGGNTIAQATLNPGVLNSVSTTVTQTLTTSVQPNTTNVQMVALQVVVTGGVNPAATMNSITLRTLGSTNATSISNIKIYYTGTTATFSATGQFGSTVTGANIPSGTNSFAVTGTQNLVVGTNYFWVAYDVAAIPTATNGNLLDAEVTSYNITTYSGGTTNQTPTVTAPTGTRQILLSYCTPNFTFGANSFGNDFWITSTSFGTLNYTGGTALGASPYYTLRPETGTVTAGQNHTLTVTKQGNTYQINMSAWADWNSDGDFSDASERLMNITNAAGGSNTFTVSNFAVPAGATVGTVRMRVMVNYTSAAPGADGCSPNAQSQGETKDFNITVAAGCTTPSTVASGVTATVASSTSLDLNLTRGNGTGGVLVVARLTATAAVAPTLSSTTYTASTNFSSPSTTTGAGNVVVYNGTGSPTVTVTTTGLTLGSNYTFDVYEYNTPTCYTARVSSNSIAPAASCSTPAVATVTGNNICSTGTTTLSLTGLAAETFTYQWEVSPNGSSWGNATGTSTNSTYTTPTTTSTAFYRCQVTCAAVSATTQSNDKQIWFALPTIGVSANTSICSGGAGAPLTATGGTSYAWAPTTGLSPTSGANVTATPATTQAYVVTGTDANGCQNTANVTVSVNMTAVTLTPSSASLAIGGSVSLSASATSLNTPITYTWAPSSSLSSATGATVTASPLSTTTYTVTATDNAGCSRTNTVTVTVTSGTLGTVACAYTSSYIGNGTWADASTLTTPTVIASGTSINNSVYPSITIPFTFNFSDQTYSSLGISSNGFIWFGSGSPSATQYTPISSTTGQTGSVDGIVSAYGRDLIAMSTGSPAIRTAITGTAPNRVFVIEWLGFNIARYSAGDEARTDLQIRLYETSNNIELWYKSAAYDLTFAGWNGASGPNETGQVGIRGASTSDYLNRGMTCGSGGWSCAAAGGSNTASMTIDGGLNCSRTCPSSATGVWPTFTGGNYRFTPTTKPTITPNGQQTICVNGPGVTLTAVNSGGMSSPTYQWQNYGSPNTDIGGQTATTYLANPSPAGNYFYTVKLTSGTCVRYSDAAAVVALPAPSTPTGISNQTRCGTGTVTFTATDPGAGFTVEWSNDGSTTNGLTGNSYTTTTIAAGNSLNVYARVKNNTTLCTSAWTSVYTATAYNLPSVATGIINQTSCGTSSFTFTANDPGAGFTVEWSDDGTAVNGNSGLSYIINVNSGNASTVYARYKNTTTGCTSASWTSATATANVIPAVATGLADQERCLSGNLTFTVTNPGAGFENQWSTNGTSNNAGTGISYVVAVSTGSQVTMYARTRNTTTGCTSAWVSAIGTANAAPVPVVSALDNTLCFNDQIDLTCDAMASYSWTGPNGFTSALQNPSITNAPLAASGTYTVNVVDANGCLGSGSVSVTVATCGSVTWLGTTDSNWNTGTNWSGGFVPSVLNDVIIPDVANDPALTTGADGAVRNVTIASGATISIATGKKIAVKGNWSGGYNTISGAGAIEFNGTAAQTITGGGIFDNITVNNTNASGLTITSGGLNQVKINQGINLQRGPVTTNGNLYLVSTATQTAYINNFTTLYTGTITGNITMERFNAGATGFRYVSMPINTPNITEISEVGLSGLNLGQLIPLANCSAAGLASGSPYGNVMEWHEDGPFPPGCRQAGWYVRSSGTLENFRGYLVRMFQNTSIVVTGAPNLTAQTYGGLLSNTNTTGDGWQLMGNPYPSPVVWTGVSGFGDMNLFSTSGLYTGTYATYAPVQSKLIAPMQGFFVRRLAPSGASFSLPNSSRRAISAVTYQDASTNWYEHLMEIDVTGNGYADHSTLYFNSGATANYDAYYDARKMDGKVDQPAIYTHLPNGGEQLGVNGLGSLDQTYVVPLVMKPGQNGEFTLNFNQLATFPATAMVYLEDLQTGTLTDLRQTNSYTFAADVNDNPERFLIRFEPAISAAIADETCEVKGAIEVTQPGTTVWSTYELRDNANNLYAQGANLSGTTTFSNLHPREYILKLTHPTGYVAQEYYTVNGVSAVNAAMAVSANDVAVNEAVNFTATSNATELVWNFGDGEQQVGANVTHSYAAAGTYNVTLTASNDNCDNVANGVITVNKTTGLTNTKAEMLTINGYGSRVTVEFNNWGGNKADIFVFNALGQRVESFTGVSTVVGRHDLYIADIKPGYYFIQVVSNGKVQGKKVYLGSN